jgi:polyhydroxyalkanoate synthesis regulator phasin
MSQAEEAVAAALEAAAKGESAESPTADESPAEGTPEAIAAAAAATAAELEDTTVKDSESAKGKGEKGPIPYDRFSKVVGERNTLVESQKELGEKVSASMEREDALRARLVQLEQEKSILDQVRGMASDPDMKAHVEAIDRKLQGVEDVKEAVEKGEISDSEATKRIEKLVKDVDTKVDDFQAEQRVKELWESTDTMATQMLDALPETYTEQDRAILGKLWNNEVDWKAIDEKGADVIGDVLKDSFALLIKDYGEPRGAIAKKAKDEVTELIPESARPRSPEDTVKGILEKDWSKTEEGKPVLSDEQYTKEMADLLRTTNAG